MRGNNRGANNEVSAGRIDNKLAETLLISDILSFCHDIEINGDVTGEHWIRFLDIVMKHYELRSTRTIPAKITKHIRYKRMQDRLQADVSERFRNRKEKPGDDVESEMRFFEREDMNIGHTNFQVLSTGDATEILEPPGPDGIVYGDDGFPVNVAHNLTVEQLNGVNVVRNTPTINLDAIIQECVMFKSTSIQPPRNTTVDGYEAERQGMLNELTLTDENKCRSRNRRTTG